MNETKFTPGPWNVWIGSGDWGMPITHTVYVGSDPYNNVGEICSIYSVQPYCAGASKKDKQRHLEGRANAHLIAAAPDLYEALDNLENDDGSIPDHAWKLVQAALAKARGEG